ncbi:MAG: hypothetical protein AB9869_02300 [Verrucomicrobiia bacterium]
MKKNVFALLTALCLSALFCGCVNTVDGGSKAGLPIATDTKESSYERPVGEIFAAAKDVLKLNGNLVKENTINHSLEAKIDTRTVWVAVEEIEPKVSRVRVQARTRGGRGDIDLASEIDKQIYGRLITR